MPSRSNIESRSYGTPVGGQSPGSVKAQPPRNKVGEADPETRRKLLNQRLNEREPEGNYKAPPKKARTEPQTGVSPNTARLLRDRGKQIDREVDKRSK
jgi:hypothetical protein